MRYLYLVVDEGTNDGAYDQSCGQYDEEEVLHFVLTNSFARTVWPRLVVKTKYWTRAVSQKMSHAISGS
jgi:hypothetical protein